MDVTDVMLHIALSAIWGSSFMFMRYLSPLIGPVATADMRMLLAGIFLAVFFAVTGFKAEWRKNGKHFLVIGIVNSGAPFLLFSFAALFLPASIEVIFNSLSPMFGAVFSAIWLGDRLTTRKVTGLVFGLAGVISVSGLENLASSGTTILAVAACFLAAACYGLAGVYIKKRAQAVKPMAIAGGSQLFAGVLLLPLIAAFPPRNPVTHQVAAVVAVFALLCSAVAYLIYFRLISRVGPTRALTVTFLMPVFGMLWGFLFLDERVTWTMIIGALVILAGTFLVTAPKRAKRPGSAF